MAKGYDPAPLVAALEGLLAERNESYREAALRSGLDHSAVRRYVCEKRRPSREALLALGDHFGVNPNELLKLAGYAPLRMFERSTEDLGGVSVDVRELVDELERIGDPVLRRRLVEAIRLLIGGYLSDVA